MTTLKDYYEELEKAEKLRIKGILGNDYYVLCSESCQLLLKQLKSKLGEQNV